MGHDTEIEGKNEFNFEFRIFAHFDLLNIAITMSSLRISIEPLEMKNNAVSTSPLWTSVSPGGACVVLNFIDKALFTADSSHINSSNRDRAG